MKILTLLFFLSSCALISPNPNRDSILSEEPMRLVQFTTDYCSEWPNGTHERPELWANCCFTHDLHYWIGGTEQERIDADKELKQCVKLKSNGLEAFLMYIGVRMGGKPGNASFAWGYGWTVKRDYLEIPTDDLIMAKKLLLESTFIQDEKTKTLVKKFITNVLDKKIPENK